MPPPSPWPLRERLATFGLTLNEEKTRLLEFGKLTAELRRKPRRPAARDVRVPRLHALLRVEPGRAFRREASHRPSAVDPEAARSPREAAASDACTGLGAAPVAVQRAPRALPLLRPAEQLASDERVLPKNCVAAGTGHFAAGASGGSRGPVFGSCSNAFPFRRRPSRIPARLVPDASFNLGRSRVRESRSLGSAGAKAEWLSYPTIPRTDGGPA